MSAAGILNPNEENKETNNHSKNDKNNKIQNFNQIYKAKLQNKILESKSNLGNINDNIKNKRKNNEPVTIIDSAGYSKIQGKKHKMMYETPNYNDPKDTEESEASAINIIEIETLKPDLYKFKNDYDFNKYDKRLLFDILKNIQKDQFSFTFSFLKQKIEDDESNEFLKLNYNFYFKNRKKIITIIKEIIIKLKFNKESFHLAIYYLDALINKLLENNQIHFEDFDFKSFATVCVLIASKFSENDPNIPNVVDYQSEKNSYFSKNHYNQNISLLKKLEVQCIMLLDYKLNFACPFHFLKIYFCLGFIFEQDFKYYLIVEKYKKLIEAEKRINNDNPHIEYNSLRIKEEKEEANNSILAFDNIMKRIYGFSDNILHILIQENSIYPFNKEFNAFNFVSAIIYISREEMYKKYIDKEDILEKEFEFKYEFWTKELQQMYSMKFSDFKNEYLLVKQAIEEAYKISKNDTCEGRYNNKKIEIIDANKSNNPEFYKIKHNTRPQSTSNSKNYNNILNFHKYENNQEDILRTLPDEYVESPKKAFNSLGNHNTDKNYSKHTNDELKLNMKYDIVNPIRTENSPIKILYEKLKQRMDTHEDKIIHCKVFNNNYNELLQKEVSIDLLKDQASSSNQRYQIKSHDIKSTDVNDLKKSLSNNVNKRYSEEGSLSPNYIENIKPELVENRQSNEFNIVYSSNIFNSKFNIKDNNTFKDNKFDLEKFRKSRQDKDTEKISKIKESIENLKNNELRNSSNLKKSTESKNKLYESSESAVMDTNKIENPKYSINKEIFNDLKKLLVNDEDLNKNSLEEIKKLLHHKNERKGNQKKHSLDNKAKNIEDLNNIIKNLTESNGNINLNEKQVSRKNFIKISKDSDQLYVKLKENKLKNFSEREYHNRNNVELKTHFQSNTGYDTKHKFISERNKYWLASNNSYEETSNLNFQNYLENLNLNYASKGENPQIADNSNKDLLDKTKKLLNKKSFDYNIYGNNQQYQKEYGHQNNEDKHYHQKKLKFEKRDNYENAYSQPKDSNSEDLKNSMIIINNNININTYVNEKKSKQKALFDKNYISSQENDYSQSINKRDKKKVFDKLNKISENKNSLEIDYDLYTNYAKIDNESDKYYLKKNYDDVYYKRNNLINNLNKNNNYNTENTNHNNNFDFYRSDVKVDYHGKYDYYENQKDYLKKNDYNNSNDIYPKNVIINSNFTRHTNENLYRKYDYVNNYRHIEINSKKFY